ncbi:MAG: hypothetical protein ACRCXD_04410 [Luteolibacter sp.]
MIWLIFQMVVRADVPVLDFAPVKLRLEKPTTANGRNFWMTPQFRIDAESGIDMEAVEKVAVIAESTFAALRAYPLPLFAPPVKHQPRISLYQDSKAYEDAGAAKGSAGFYSGVGEARVLIRADYFLQAVVVEKGRDTPTMDEDLIVHELVHMGMHRKLAGLPQWFVDGIAEYFGSAHAGGGRFSFSRMDQAVRDHLRVKLVARGSELRLLPVASIATLDDKEWLAFMKSLPPEERYLAYATALLLTHYHLHGGAERLERIREGLTHAERQRKPPGFLTLDDAPAIEAALFRFWRNKGLELSFAAASP